MVSLKKSESRIYVELRIRRELTELTLKAVFQLRGQLKYGFRSR